MSDKQKVVDTAPTAIPTEILVLPKSVAPQVKPLAKLKQNPLLLGLLILIPLVGIGYFAYNQFVLVPQQQAKNKVQTTIASLLSEDNKWVNAQRIEVSGGQSI